MCAVLLLLLLGAFVALQMPAVQTRLAHKACEMLNGKLDGTVSVGSIKILPPGVVVVKDLAILDDHPYTADTFSRGWAPADTFASASRLSATLSLKGLFKSEGLHLGRVRADDLSAHLAIEPDGRTNIERIFRISGESEPMNMGPIFDARSVEANHARYRMTNFGPETREYRGGINYEDLDVTFDVKGHDIKFVGGRIYGVCDHLSMSEKCGYELNELTGEVAVGQGNTTINDIHMVDPWSEVFLSSYTMDYGSAKDFAHYTDNVVMEGRFSAPSLVNLKSVFCFGSSEPNLDLGILAQEGHAKGTVNDLMVEDIKFSIPGTGVSGVVDGKVKALEHIPNTFFDVKVSDLAITTAGAAQIAGKFSPEAAKAVASIAPGHNFKVNLASNGTPGNLNLNAAIGSDCGSATVKGNLSGITDKGAATKINGTITTTDLDAGSLLGIDAIGPVSLKTTAKAAFQGNKTDLVVDSLSVSRLNALGYDYSNINAAGKFSDNVFDGKLVCSDPNLNFMFKGILSLPGKSNDALYKFYANLGYADLEALHIDKRGTSKASGQLSANFRSVSDAGLIGDINLKNIKLENDAGVHDIGNLAVSSHSNQDGHRIQLISSIADGGYVGGKALGAIVEDIQNITTRKHLPALYPGQDDNPVKSAGSPYDVSFTLHDTRALLAFLMPGAYIEEDTAINLNIDPSGTLNATVNSGLVQFGDNYVTGLGLRLDNLDDALHCSLNSDKMSIGGVELKSGCLNANARDNAFEAALHYSGMTGLDNAGDVYLDGDFSRSVQDSLIITARPQESHISTGDKRWDISESLIRLNGHKLEVQDFNISSGEESINVDGTLWGDGHEDGLAVTLSNLDLAIANHLTESDLGFGGRASGKATLSTSPDTGFGFTADIGCDSLKVGGADAGNLKLTSGWNDSLNAIDLHAVSTVAGHEAIGVDGWLKPKGGILNADATLDKVNLELLAPFVKDIFSSTSGSLSGHAHIGGTLENLDIGDSAFTLDGAKLQVAFTGAEYTLDGGFGIGNDGLHLKDIAISDRQGGSGQLFGSLGFDHLRNFNLDAGVRMNNLLAIDIDEAHNHGVYGKLAVSGNAMVTGPLDAIRLDANIRTAGSGNVNVPISGSATTKTSDLLTFTQAPSDDESPVKHLAVAVPKAPGMAFTAHARVIVTPEVMANVEIDRENGNVISASGNADVTLDLNPAKDIFEIDGDYSIDRGSLHFEVPGIVSKDFDIESGSNVKFAGDLLDSQVDIAAVYNLKTSLATLLADSTAVSSRHEVQCGINISDRLSNPTVGFSITVPDLEPTTKAQVESALNTEDKVQKQFMSLLLLGTFLPSETSGIVNGGNILYSNVSQVMAGQFNNMLQKLNIPVDLGFGYQQNESGTDIFDVAISTQLFNNRVVVNGSLGNRKYSTSTSADGDLVGDIDIEYKVDRSGQLRVKAFSHSADEYTSYLDYSQRNGLGITYQKEYNSLVDFLRGLLAGREEREKMAREQAEHEKDLTVIRID